jgi:hypothetical protein
MRSRSNRQESNAKTSTTGRVQLRRMVIASAAVVGAGMTAKPAALPNVGKYVRVFSGSV